MNRHLVDPHLARETAKSILGGLVGAVGSNLSRLRTADPNIVHGMNEVVADLLPMILVNSLMSTLIPAVVILWRQRRIAGEPDLLASLAVPAGAVLGLTIAGAITAIGMVHLTAFALSLPGLTASGILLVGAAQAVVVAVTLTPLTITLLSSRSIHG